MSGLAAVTSASANPAFLSGATQGMGKPEDNGAPFRSLLGGAMQSIDTLESRAHTAVDGLMTGAGVDVHEAVIATQKASMAFELALAVRNKTVQAYQSVMGMQF